MFNPALTDPTPYEGIKTFSVRDFGRIKGTNISHPVKFLHSSNRVAHCLLVELGSSTCLLTATEGQVLLKGR